MKRESGRSPTHHFSFGERFDIKSAVGTAAPSQPVCPCADRQSYRHNGTEHHTRLAKRERQRQTANTAAGFWEQKAIAH